MTGQCCFRNSGNSWTVIPSTPGLPLLALTRANACLQFSRSQTSSINCSPIARLSVPRFAASDSVPSADSLGASLLLSSVKANISWFFCRLSLMSCAAYLPFPLTPRSEEHTSELQSQSNLVCRLLLEKKKNPTSSRRHSGPTTLHGADAAPLRGHLQPHP